MGLTTNSAGHFNNSSITYQETTKEVVSGGDVILMANVHFGSEFILVYSHLIPLLPIVKKLL
jgi:hypothetical protein